MMDDILVVGKNREEHDKRLWEVLVKIEKAGMTLNKSKCEFGVKEVKFLGHILSTKGISVDPEKERAIREMPPGIRDTRHRTKGGDPRSGPHDLSIREDTKRISSKDRCDTVPVLSPPITHTRSLGDSEQT